MGVVHLALDPQGSMVAVKVLRPETTESMNARLRLAREVETMRRVRSPFVAEVLDADVTGEFPYIVTRYVPGPTLEAMVRSRGPLSGSGLRLLAYGTAEALTAIHAAGVVHRDLKPGNVMLADDRPVVIDFGIAQSPDATRLTQDGLVMGTPGYLAPEVIEGLPSSPASDVHSWAATLAFAATGRAPFGGGGDSYQTIFYRIISGRPDLSGVPAPLVPLLSAALASDPGRRPPATWLSAQATALDLSAAGLAASAVGPRPTATLTGPAQQPAPPAAVQARRLPWPGRSSPAPPPSRPAQPGPAQSRKARKAAKRAAPAAYPAPQQAARDVADLLPPAQGPHAPLPARPPLPAQPPLPPPARARTTMAGSAVIIAAVALTLILPVAGLVMSLAVITVARAADRAADALASRRSVHGPRASDPLVVAVSTPLALAHALLIEALIAPLAFAAAAVVYVVTLVLSGAPALPQAGAYAAAAVVAWYGLGPGSGKPRRQLNRMAAPLARTSLSAAVTALAVWALAIGAVIFAVSQRVPYYWPLMTPHLPSLHGWPLIGSYPRLNGALNAAPRLPDVFSSAANWLFRQAGG